MRTSASPPGKPHGPVVFVWAMTHTRRDAESAQPKDLSPPPKETRHADKLNGNYWYHLFYMAVQDGNFEAAQTYLLTGAHAIEGAPWSAQQTALLLAISRKDDTAVERLIEEGADANLGPTGSLDGTPLLFAIYSRNWAVIQLLLDAGADANHIDIASENGSALGAAISSGDTAIVYLLLRAGANTNQKFIGSDANMAISRAISKNDRNFIRTLLDAGVSMTGYNKLKLMTQFPEFAFQIQYELQVSSENTRTILCGWELPSLAESLRRGADRLDISCVPTLTKKRDYVLFSTCADYLRKTYGASSVDLLHYITCALEDPRGFYYGTDLKIMTSAEHIIVTFPESMESVLEALKWLCLTFRSNSARIPHISSGAFHGKYFKLDSLRPLSRLHNRDTFCWTMLFDYAVIAVVSATDAAPEWWLAMSFEEMLQLTAVEYPVSVDSGTILMGYSTALIPVEKTGSNMIQWHLEIAGHDGQFKVSELKATRSNWLQEEDIECLRTERVLLGWCPNAAVLLGTDHATKEVKWSGARRRRTSWRWTGANLPLLAQSAAPVQLGGQLGFTFTRKFNVVRFSPSNNYLKCLRNSVSEQIIVYDTTQRRAWLVPLVCVLHQMLLSFSSKSPTVHGPAYTIPQTVAGSDNNAGYASFETLKDNGLVVIERSGDVDLTIRELIMGFSVNLSKTSLHEPNGREIYGYELMDIIMDSPHSELKQMQLDRQGIAWSPLLAEINCLFC
ncbi:ankyrin repeat domain-containing protein [Aspergillus lucknowensis]|uniref:Ankyrin repeat-containing domain protein n=1 Tax=Aspergillus lucknowensis TaxID=176173 RepID=A0ABR4L5G1_9EURO